MSENADSPAVILYYQHHRRLKDTREIQGFVEISLGRCSIATYTNGDCLIARYFLRHGQANSMQQLCANHDLNGKAMDLTRIVLRSKTAKCVDERGQGKPRDHQGDKLAIRHCQPVLRLPWSVQPILSNPCNSAFFLKLSISKCNTRPLEVVTVCAARSTVRV